MKKYFLCLIMLLSLTACKKESKNEQAASNASVVTPTPVIKPQPSIDELALRSLAQKEDWTKDLAIYIGDVTACAKSAPGQTKYVFRADAFEKPSIALILLKTEDDKVYACSIGETDPAPHFREIFVHVPEKGSRFYPGELPKPDSCLENTRVLDKSGHIAGWLAKIIC